MEIIEKKVIDPFYFCVSVENIDYRPIAYEEILKQFN
jgi:calcineurin-like phosphoesterase family protein